MEILNLSGTNDTDTADTTQTGASTGDTVVSNFQRPLFAVCVGNVDGVDGWATSIGSGSAAAEKTITLTNSGQTTAACALLIFGF
jgi:hypothetical protein